MRRRCINDDSIHSVKDSDDDFMRWTNRKRIKPNSMEQIRLHHKYTYLDQRFCQTDFCHVENFSSNNSIFDSEIGVDILKWQDLHLWPMPLALRDFHALNGVACVATLYVLLDPCTRCLMLMVKYYLVRQLLRCPCFESINNVKNLESICQRIKMVYFKFKITLDVFFETYGEKYMFGVI